MLMPPAFTQTVRDDGALPIEAYGVLGDGRTLALSGADGSIDWWCVPNMDSPPLFDRLLDAPDGGFFVIAPVEAFSVQRHYLSESNVLVTEYRSAGGRARLTESLNSGGAGRLPWEELARRVEGLEGTMTFAVRVRLGRQADTVNPYLSAAGPHRAFHVGPVLGVVLASAGLVLSEANDAGLRGELTVRAGEREIVAIVAGADEPLIVPAIADVDARIDLSDREWRQWASALTFAGEDRQQVLRHALALKLLL